ncbi:hypothetical protein [Sedimenticola selenatireducens]|uniref:Uncharacterized protein n=1 Tax=Sedimenticola selenatireducens TaxID=191960 RepID=A0A557SKD9_9GAMM|nr:hypothetical protein [Sedimenticola selenatireducens]TVO77843.1 hypothetical protein FHP88_03325 [Sedimenticola selenatireducens]TVT65148.1 MAG: hypothetical protein FHK78_05690 [Sedimenticola selenatireducens]
MKQRLISRRHNLLLILPLLLMLFWVPPSQADAIDGLANLLEKVEDAGVPPNWLPIKSGDIRASKGLIVCLDNAGNDIAVAHCIDDYQNTPIGSELSGQAGIPSWVFDLLELYISYREGDYWGVVKYLGKAAICIVAQVMTGGAVDVCGLIEDLIKVAEELLDAAKAVAQFFTSLGEGAWEAAKDIGCSLGLGGCGKSSPPEQIAYAWVFQPRVGQGLTAIEATDPSGLYTLRQQLEQNALHAPPIWSIVGIPSTVYANGLPKGAVDIASQVFTKAVDAQWTKHMVVEVLGKLATKRSQYNTPSKVTTSAQVVAGLSKSSPSAVASEVIKRCSDDFVYASEFAHVDRWIMGHKSEADKVKALTHQQWCGAVFWKGNKSVFAQRFHDYLKANGCSLVNNKLYCSSVSSYNNCSALMKSVDQEGLCKISSAAGNEIAKSVRDALISKGSKYPCEIKGSLKFSSSKRLICSRPTLQASCKETYKSLYPDYPANLLSCELKMDSDYSALLTAVNQKVAQLNSQMGSGILGGSAKDPLVILASSSGVVAAVQSLPNQDFGFGPPSTSKAFDYQLFGGVPKHIDGVNTPLLMFEMTFNKDLPIEKKNPLESKLELVNPKINPTPFENQKGNAMQELKGGVLSTSPSMGGFAGGQSLPQQKALSGPLPGGTRQSGGFAPQTAAPNIDHLQQAPMAAAPAPTLGGIQLPEQKTLSGPSPESQNSTNGLAPRVGRLPPTSGTRGTTSTQVTVLLAGRQWRHGDAIILSDQQAVSKENGLCNFELRQQWLNPEATPVAMSQRRWHVAPAGGTAQRVSEHAIRGGIELVDRIALPPGQNRLTLSYAAPAANAMKPLLIQVTGNCRPAGRLGLPTKEESGETANPAPRPTAPTSRLRLPTR